MMNPESSTQKTEILVQAKNLTKDFTLGDGKAKLTTHILKGITMSVVPGEFVAIVGASGSGKSTLLYCLSGLEPLTTGDVSLLGSPLTYSGQSSVLTDHQSSGIGFVFQSYQLLKFLSVKDNILLPTKYNGQFDAAVQRLPKVLADLGLSEKIDAKVADLSGGQQQRVAIARSLISQASLIFADEPTGALDTKNAREVAAILRTIPDKNRSVVMVTHDLEMAAQASRILVLSDGQIIKELGTSSASEILSAMSQSDHDTSVKERA